MLALVPRRSSGSASVQLRKTERRLTAISSSHSVTENVSRWRGGAIPSPTSVTRTSSPPHCRSSSWKAARTCGSTVASRRNVVASGGGGCRSTDAGMSRIAELASRSRERRGPAPCRRHHIRRRRPSGFRRWARAARNRCLSIPIPPGVPVPMFVDDGWGQLPQV